MQSHGFQSKSWPWSLLPGTFRTVSPSCITAFNVLGRAVAHAVVLFPFHSEAYLLKAEEQFCARNFDDAGKLYHDAILSSKKHKFVNEEALANELAGNFYLDTGRKYNSLQYFCQAEEKYRKWGAASKANELLNYLRCN